MKHEFKSLSEIPDPPKESVKPVTNRERIHLYEPRRKEPVVNSEDIKWKPVDIVAVRVVAKAPWWAEPPQPEPKMRDELPKEPPRIKSKRMLTDEGYVEELLNTESVAPAAVDQHGKTVKAGLKASEELIERARELVDTIDFLAKGIQEPWDEYQRFIKKSIVEVREQRIALSSETRLLMGSLKEVRQFFLEEAYETEINRLHEFIDLCERLQALKESGFLDAVADTILKLNE
jgi:hypothetical protein